MIRRLCGMLLCLCVLLLCAVTPQAEAEQPDTRGEKMPLSFAQNFRVETLENGMHLLTLGEREQFLLVPEGAGNVPAEFPDLPRISIPVRRVYLASSSVADLFLQLGALDHVRFTSTDASGWQLPELRAAIDGEDLLYVGKYSAPDYELLLEEGCDLVVENTMILHKPETREMLQNLGFPVMLEYSSYEPHPLGRVEWIKLYGLLTGESEAAERFFTEQEALFRNLEAGEKSGKTVAFFHITANGAVVVRRESDYVTRMIELAGGESAIRDLPPSDSALSTATIQMESFYAQARDADILVYNSTVAGEVPDMDRFLTLSPLLSEFRAVQNGEVWCTEQSMFQRSSAAVGMISDFREILRDAPDEDSLTYLYRID